LVRIKVSKVFQKQRDVLWLMATMRILKTITTLQMKVTRKTVIDDRV
jgi:hypothetical protein